MPSIKKVLPPGVRSPLLRGRKRFIFVLSLKIVGESMYGWGGGWRWGWSGPWPGRGPFSHLPPWQRPGWLFGRGACWWLFGGPWGWYRPWTPYYAYPPFYYPYYPWWYWRPWP